jgi:hypothetical protein
VEADADGFFTTPALELLYGDYEITAVAIDAANNTSEPSAPVFYQAQNDWQAPVTAYLIEGERLPEGAYLDTVTVHFTATDDASGVDQTQVSYDGGGSWVDYAGAMSFEEPGMYAISYFSIDFQGNEEAPKTIYFVVTDVPELQGFESWLQQIADEAQRHPDACPMGDGIPNLAKYALGLDPDVFHSEADVFESLLEDGHLVLRYKKSKQATDAFIIPEWSQTLAVGSWQRTGIEQQNVEAGETDTHELREARLPRIESEAFMRLFFSIDPADAPVSAAP